MLSLVSFLVFVFRNWNDLNDEFGPHFVYALLFPLSLFLPNLAAVVVGMGSELGDVLYPTTSPALARVRPLPARVASWVMVCTHALDICFFLYEVGRDMVLPPLSICTRLLLDGLLLSAHLQYLSWGRRRSIPTNSIHRRRKSKGLSTLNNKTTPSVWRIHPRCDIQNDAFDGEGIPAPVFHPCLDTLQVKTNSLHAKTM